MCRKWTPKLEYACRRTDTYGFDGIDPIQFFRVTRGSHFRRDCRCSVQECLAMADLRSGTGTLFRHATRMRDDCIHIAHDSATSLRRLAEEEDFTCCQATSGRAVGH